MNFINLEDALKYFDLNFDIASEPIYFGQNEDIPFKKVVIRTDKRIPLGVVGNKYKLVPLRTTLASVQSLIDDNSIDVSKFYSEGHGAKVSCCFKVRDCWTELDSLMMNAEFALRLSHDGSSKILVSILARSTEGNVYPISNEYSLSVRHTKNAEVKLTNLDKIISKVKGEWYDFEQFMRYGATDPITHDEAKEFIATNMGVTAETKQGEAALEAIFKRWSTLVFPSMRNTIFGLYIATCDWCQQDRAVKLTAKRKQAGLDYETVRLMNLLNNKNIYKTWAGVRGFANINKGFDS